MNTYTRDNFIYRDILEKNTDLIKQDFHQVYGDTSDLQIIKPPKQNAKPNSEWVGSFAYFVKRSPRWDDKCGAKSKVLKQLVNQIPNNHLRGIWFSAILPGGLIPWHVDMYGGTMLIGEHDADSSHIRVHLPLDVPEGDLGITVDKTTHVWKKGEVFCFNPFVIHTAWNYSDKIRLNANFNFSREAFIC
jgi:hypothetical protein